MNTVMLAIPQFAVEAALKAMATVESINGPEAKAYADVPYREFMFAKECMEYAVKEGPPKMEPEIATALQAAFFKQDRT